MRKLSLEAFKLLMETDPIPHVIINGCKNPETTIPFLLETTLVVSEEEWKDELVPSDGCGVFVTDSDGECPIDHLEHERTITWFDTRTPLSEEKFVISSIDCDDALMAEVKKTKIVVDIRRQDEVEHFGSPDFSIKKPLHELLHDITHDVGVANILGVGPENDPEKPLVVFCRTNRRAKFCAQLLHDAQVKDVEFVTKGAVGLSEKKELHMHAYNSYEVGEDFPEFLN
eukprot:m.22036 g.22036  ORF g.22036 m.22036 type:complete len:228 (-) comp5414_c0_seq1:181-864(-)